MQHLGITMDASPESAWRKSDNSRGLNTLILSSSSRRFGYGGDTGCKKEDNSRVVAARQNLKNQGGLSGVCREEVPVDPCLRSMGCDDVSLRQWLDKPERSVDKFECLHIFRQIVEIVSVAHSQGVVVHNVRPSCFVMSSFDHVSFIESASCSESGSDSSEDVMSSHIVQIKHGSLLKPVDMQQQQRSIFESEDFKSTPTDAISEVVSKQGSSLYSHVPLVKEAENRINDDKNSGEETLKQHFPMKQVLLMETSWYVSPEEAAGSSGSYASDVYRLGVILFELFCPFSSREDKIRIMASLKHRVLPPLLLLKWPKEASFCLWLLHPEPSSRPKMSELLESEFLNEIRDNLEEREASVKLREEIEEQDLLLEFLSLIQGRKQEAADKLQHSVSLVCSDIEEVRKRQLLLNRKEGSCAERMKSDFFTSGLPPMNIVTSDNSSGLGSRKRSRPDLRFCSLEEECDDNLNGIQNTELVATQESLLSKNSRLMKNFKKLESAYFLTRCRPTKPYGTQVTRNSPVSSDGKGSVFATERSSINNLAPKGQYAEDRRSGWITPFLEGLCKYLSFSKLEVRAELTQGDFLNSSNLVCALGFDRDGEFFATAGVNKKIKVFECDSIITERRDIHYPVVEMASKSKLSSICWNSYIKSQIASSNFEGVVQIWDVTSSQVLTEMREHERRVWSVDFSSADPTMLASGSDDGSVKLWSINQGASIGTIKTKANVCSVQFPSDSGRFLAFGSADHRVYYYDLRNAKLPLATLIGHNKTVSYVKFVDSTSLASASTDNTVKLWDLSVCTSRINDTPVQSFTGHMNIKNFVGLSVSNGYLATGSETNEVFIYHKAFPMPALSFKFNNTDPVSGLEMDDALQFVSSVCWRGQSSTLVAANSTGNIKILEMV